MNSGLELKQEYITVNGYSELCEDNTSFKCSAHHQVAETTLVSVAVLETAEE